GLGLADRLIGHPARGLVVLEEFDHRGFGSGEGLHRGAHFLAVAVAFADRLDDVSLGPGGIAQLREIGALRRLLRRRSSTAKPAAKSTTRSTTRSATKSPTWSAWEHRLL